MIAHYVKVKIQGKKQPIYLEQAKYITKQLADLCPPDEGVRLHAKANFLRGYQVTKQGEPVTTRDGGAILHLVELSENVSVINQIMNKKYCELENEVRNA